MGESSDIGVVGRYQIVREIGRGGMAVVYLAHDPRLARQVAIKLIAGHALADEYVRRSFEREAQAIGSLQHPHILPVYDVGEHDGQTYLVMHYVEGGRTLRDLVRSGPVDPREVGRLLIEVGHALGYAHSLGLVHRDIKPHNILIEAAGHSYLADFGLAKAAAGTGVSLATKGSIGTPAYMSPEQIRAVQAIDHHADIYSLAVTTFELLTGRQPYTGDLGAVLYQHCFAEIPAARALVPSLPRPVDDVLRRALAKEPGDRYPTAWEFVTALQAAIRGGVTATRVTPSDAAATATARVPGVPESAVTAHRSAPNWWLFGGIATAVVAMMLAGLFWSLTGRGAADVRVSPTALARVGTVATGTPEPQAAVEPQPSPTFSRALVLPPTERSPTPANGPAVTAQLLQPTARLLTGHSRPVFAVAFSPDGRTLASSAYDQIRLWDVGSGQTLRVLEGHTAPIYSLAFGRDGQTLLSGSDDRTIRIWNTETGQTLRSLTGHTGTVHSVTIAPDGRTAASGGIKQPIRFWDLASGRQTRTIETDLGAISLAFSPDGKTLAVANAAVQLWDVESGQLRHAYLEESLGATTLSFSPDGRLVVAGLITGVARVWDVGTGQMVASLEGHTDALFGVAFNADGRTIATGSLDSTVGIWELYAGVRLARLTGPTEAVTGVAFSPDGRTLASGSQDTSVRLWNVAGAQSVRTIVGHNGGVTALAFAPDGTTLASAAADQTARLWDLASGQARATLQGHTDVVQTLAFAPDGRSLATAANDRNVRLWETSTGQSLRALQGHSEEVLTLAFRAGGRTLASGSADFTVRLWNVETGDQRGTVRGHAGKVTAVAFSPDGMLLASGSEDHSIRVYSVNGETVEQAQRTLRGHSGTVTALAFSPDGRLLASASADQTVRFWDVATGQQAQRFEGHTGRVTHVAFAPDGMHLASASADKTVRVWDLASGQTVRTLAEHAGDVTAVVFSPDGLLLATASSDRTIRLWDARYRAARPNAPATPAPGRPPQASPTTQATTR